MIRHCGACERFPEAYRLGYCTVDEEIPPEIIAEEEPTDLSEEERADWWLAYGHGRCIINREPPQSLCGSSSLIPKL